MQTNLLMSTLRRYNDLMRNHDLDFIAAEIVFTRNGYQLKDCYQQRDYIDAFDEIYDLVSCMVSRMELAQITT